MAHFIKLIDPCVGAVVVAAVHVLQGDVAPVVQGADLRKGSHRTEECSEIELVILSKNENPSDSEVEEHQEHHPHHVEQRANRGDHGQHDDLEISDPGEKRKETKKINNSCTLCNLCTVASVEDRNPNDQHHAQVKEIVTWVEEGLVGRVVRQHPHHDVQTQQDLNCNKDSLEVLTVPFVGAVDLEGGSDQDDEDDVTDVIISAECIAKEISNPLPGIINFTIMAAEWSAPLSWGTKGSMRIGKSS
jgi:hypothetical protein